jgi:hypothetical protein
MLKSTSVAFILLSLFVLWCTYATQNASNQQTGTLERMLVTSGKVAIDLDLSRLASVKSDESRKTSLQFEIATNSFFTIRILNHLLRGPETGTMALIPRNAASWPRLLSSSANQLVIERVPSGGRFDLVLRDSQTGFAFFDIEGQNYDYDASTHLFHIKDGRLLISQALANNLGRGREAGAQAGTISIDTAVTPIATTILVNGKVKSSILPPGNAYVPGAPAYAPGPDIVVGDLTAMVQSGSSGTQVGLGIGTTSCNNGDQPVHFFAIPNTDHSVVSQNLYRMSGGTNNNDRFEQIGESWVKHTFAADQFDDCNYGCTPFPNGTQLGVGCSDPYSASENATYSLLGSRAWVNPFTGAFPSNARDHTGHTHTGTSHRVLVPTSDLNTSLNVGATYWAEAEYDTPQEYAWCQAHPGQCNMYNNASYRQFTVTGTTNFTFAPVGTTTRMKPATEAWTGSMSVLLEPEPGVDGRAFVVYKVTNPSAGVWHYEYAIHNQNLDRSIQSFSVPLGCGVTISNVGFHAPPNHPGFANDGTLNNQGYSNAAWLPNQTSSSVTWSCETFAQNQNANAIRFGTLYNFRFDSSQPPASAMATVGFFKTGAPITVQIQAPMADPCNPLQLTSVVSRKTHGAAGDFDVDLPLTDSAGVECRSTGGNHTLVFTFTNHVVSGNASVTSGVGTVSGSPIFSNNTMTVNLTGVSDQQQITVTASNVMDTFGQTLPDTAVNAVILAGDTNGNRTVNAADVAQTKAQQGAPVDPTNFRTDVNANGTINAADTSLVKANAGNSVP